jgi:hypothetical protein
VWAYPALTLANLSLRLSGLPCDCILSTTPARVELGTLLLFYFSMVFSCPVTSFLFPNVLPLLRIYNKHTLLVLTKYSQKNFFKSKEISETKILSSYGHIAQLSGCGEAFSQCYIIVSCV